MHSIAMDVFITGALSGQSYKLHLMNIRQEHLEFHFNVTREYYDNVCDKFLCLFHIFWYITNNEQETLLYHFHE